MTASLLTRADNAPVARPGHARERWTTAGAKTASVLGVELKAVLERGLELTEGAVEPADLAAALVA